MDITPADPVVPKPAATVMLIRDGTNGLEVLVLEKAAGKHFAGGALVFPGGKVEAQDEAFTGPIGEERHPLSTFKIAAVREMFEECGILLARRRGTRRHHGCGRSRSVLRFSPLRNSSRFGGISLA